MANEWRTDKVCLRPIEPDDWELEFAIMSDTELIRYFDTVDFLVLTDFVVKILLQPTKWK